MAFSSEQPTNFQSNPEKYLEEFPDAVKSKERAHDLALMTDAWESRSADLRLGLKAIVMHCHIRRETDRSRYILVSDDNLEAWNKIPEPMQDALQEDAYYNEDNYPEAIKKFAGPEALVFSVDAAIDQIKSLNSLSENTYDEANLLLDELEATKQ